MSGDAEVMVTLQEEEGERPFFVCTVVGHATKNTSWSIHFRIDSPSGVDPQSDEGFERAVCEALSRRPIGAKSSVGHLGGAENDPELSSWKISLARQIYLELPLGTDETEVHDIYRRVVSRWRDAELTVQLVDSMEVPVVEISPEGSIDELEVRKEVLRGKLVFFD